MQTNRHLRPDQVRSVHDWSGQVGSGPVRRRQVRSDQVRSPLRISGVPSLELVAVKKKRTSRTSHNVNRQCVAKDRRTANKPTMKHRENGMRPSGNPGEWSMMRPQTRKALHAVLRTRAHVRKECGGHAIQETESPAALPTSSPPLYRMLLEGLEYDRYCMPRLKT